MLRGAAEELEILSSRDGCTGTTHGLPSATKDWFVEQNTGQKQGLCLSWGLTVALP